MVSFGHLNLSLAYQSFIRNTIPTCVNRMWRRQCGVPSNACVLCVKILKLSEVSASS